MMSASDLQCGSDCNPLLSGEEDEDPVDGASGRLTLLELACGLLDRVAGSLVPRLTVFVTRVSLGTRLGSPARHPS